MNIESRWLDASGINMLANSLLAERDCVIAITEVKDNGRDLIPIYGDDRVEYCQGKHNGFAIECVLIYNGYRHHIKFHCTIKELINESTLYQLLADGIARTIIGFITTGSSYYESSAMRIAAQCMEVQLETIPGEPVGSVYERETDNPIKTPELLGSFNELGERKLDI